MDVYIKSDFATKGSQSKAQEVYTRHTSQKKIETALNWPNLTYSSYQ